MEIRRGRRKLDYTGRVAGGRRQETTITVCDIIMLIQQMEPEGQARGRTGWRGHLLLNHASCEVNRIVNDERHCPWTAPMRTTKRLDPSICWLFTCCPPSVTESPLLTLLLLLLLLVFITAQLESLDTRRNNLSRSFFKIFVNQPPVFIILFHLPEIAPLPLG